MQPLSRQTRTIVLASFTIAFCALVPLVMLYANGWRFSPTLGLYKTGGVFVAVPYSGVTVSLNGETIGTTGILQRSFYISNLAPSTYVLRASGDGYYPWERMVVVEPQLVTDARTLLVSTHVSAARLVATSTATSTASMQVSESVVAATLFTEYSALFNATSTSSSTLPVDIDEGTGLFIEAGDLFARLVDPESPIPSAFCPRPSLCLENFPLERSSDTVLDAAFFGGGVIYSTKEHGIYLTELDSRPTPRIVPLYEKPGAEFRIVDGTLIVKDGPAFYQVEL